jgi:hypothetical protein
MNGPKVMCALSPVYPQHQTFDGAVGTTVSCRLCCKSLFALVIKNSPGFRRDIRVKMWGTSSPDDKLTGDLGSVIETTQIGGRRLDRLMAGKLSPGNFGLLQQYLPEADICAAANSTIIQPRHRQPAETHGWAPSRSAICYPGLAGGTLRAGQLLDSEQFRSVPRTCRPSCGRLSVR